VARFRWVGPVVVHPSGLVAHSAISPTVDLLWTPDVTYMRLGDGWAYMCAPGGALVAGPRLVAS
jgi:hypothetical protein